MPDDQDGQMILSDGQAPIAKAEICPGMPLPFARGSETSEKAARSMKISAASWRARILEHIRAKPSTCDEIEAEMNGTHQNISARITELKRLGFIVDSGERRRTRSNRLAVVYTVA